MSNPPNTKNFRAWINLMPGSPSKLIVVGEVETSASNKKPVLTRAIPQGTVSQVLILDLHIASQGGIGTQAFQFWPVRHEEDANKGQFTQVSIRWDGEPLMNLKVSEAH